ncbi:hypothetical protein [Dactylosporangium sp. CA-092794]|uniref:hypothetical protein n=1 Tax=Dactylosporangium sp. CA-092794 TaxID=3239929 RepID=UPI003D906F3C
MTTWLDLDERDDHYPGLAGAHVVAAEALLQLRDNLADVLHARAMMCVHGDAGLGKTLSVNAALRSLAPADVCRVQFRPACNWSSPARGLWGPRVRSVTRICRPPATGAAGSRPPRRAICTANRANARCDRVRDIRRERFSRVRPGPTAGCDVTRA